MAQRTQSLAEPFIYTSEWESRGNPHEELRSQLRDMGFRDEMIDHALTTHSVSDINDALQLIGRDETLCSICRSPTSPPPLETCEICLESRESLSKLSCDHRFCPDCLCSYAEAVVTSGKVLHVKCPQAHCEQEMEDLERWLSREMAEKMRRYRRIQLVSQELEARWCPTPDCDNVLRDGSPSKPKMTCGKCNAEVCFHCGGFFHPRKTCSQAADKAYECWAKGKDIQHCPICRRRIEKEDGCNHMQCPACSYQWCWLCRGRYSDMHYSSLNPFGCPGLQSSEHTLARWPWYKRWMLRLCILMLFPMILVFGVPVLFTYKTMELLDDRCYTRSTLCACVKYCMLLPIVFAVGILCTPFVVALSCPPLACFLLVNCLTTLRFHLRVWASRFRRDSDARAILV